MINDSNAVQCATCEDLYFFFQIQFKPIRLKDGLQLDDGLKDGLPLDDCLPGACSRYGVPIRSIRFEEWISTAAVME